MESGPGVGAVPVWLGEMACDNTLRISLGCNMVLCGWLIGYLILVEEVNGHVQSAGPAPNEMW